jgi:hypothetical protein
MKECRAPSREFVPADICRRSVENRPVVVDPFSPASRQARGAVLRSIKWLVLTPLIRPSLAGFDRPLTDIGRLAIFPMFAGGKP